MAAKKSKKVKEDDRDPVERAPFEQRRGTLKAWDYNSWEASSIFVGGKGGQGGLDAIVKNLSKAKKVGVVQADVTKDALAGKIPQPDAPHIVIVKLKGHDWAPLFASHAESYDTDTLKEISKDAGTKVIWCGHQDTASATGFQLFEKGEQIVHFESVGDGYDEDEEPDEMFGTNFKSKLHKKNWWKSHENEDQTLQALVKEQGAYVPLFMVGPEKGKLDLEAFPEDTLEPAHVERVVLAVYGPAKKARPSAEGKKLLAAIDAMNVKAIEAALAAGADQNYLPGRKETALAYAVDRVLRDPDKHMPVIDALLRGGADVNDPGERGNYPIWEVIEGVQGLDKKLPVLLRLIAAGADVNALSKGGYQKGVRPLHFVAVAGDIEMAKFLIAHGADPKLTNADGETPAKNARGVMKTMLAHIDDEGGKHTGPIKAVIELLAKVEKGKLKAKDFSKNPTAVIEAERKRNEKLRAEITAAFEDVGKAFKSLDQLERAEKKGDEKAIRKAATKIANLAQPSTIRVLPIADSPERWGDLKRRNEAVRELQSRGFEFLGEFRVSGQEFLNMVALLHVKRNVYAAVCEMLNNTWVDFVQYYSDGTQLEATNVQSAPESWVEMPKRTKIRQPRWKVGKLADHMLEAKPPTGATVKELIRGGFPHAFEADYAAEMRARRRQ